MALFFPQSTPITIFIKSDRFPHRYNSYAVVVPFDMRSRGFLNGNYSKLSQMSHSARLGQAYAFDTFFCVQVGGGAAPRKCKLISSNYKMDFLYTRHTKFINPFLCINNPFIILLVLSLKENHTMRTCREGEIYCFVCPHFAYAYSLHHITNMGVKLTAAARRHKNINVD